MTDIKTHIIFATQAAAEAAQQTAFERLVEAHGEMAGTTSYDTVMQFNEGWGFANPEKSFFKDYAGVMLESIGGTLMNATMISEGE